MMIEDMEFDKKEKKLTPKQKLFCFHYVKNDELRFNWTLAYDEAYEIWLSEKSIVRAKDIMWDEIPWSSEYDKAYNLCSVNASKLLRLTKIQNENEKLLNQMLNNKKVDSRLAEILFTWKHSDSLNAIEKYNKLKSRITDKIELKWTFSLVDLHKKSEEG